MLASASLATYMPFGNATTDALQLDFFTATALSGINQALYELLAKREQVPVWRLFREKATIEKVALYTTINRSLKERSVEEYLELVGELGRKGFKQFKCAPFEKVNSPMSSILAALARC